MKNKIKVLFVVPYPLNTAPCQRFRFEQYFDLLKCKGITYAVDPFVSPGLHRIIYKKGKYIAKFLYTFCCFLRRFYTVIRAFRYDIVFIHRETSPFGFIFFELFLKHAGKKIIFDFDDAVYLPNFSGANNIARLFKNYNKIKKIISISDVVIAGNSHLERYAVNFNKNVIVIPTTIDTDKYPLIEKERRKNAPVCIGWSGSYTTIQHFILLENVFKRLRDKFNVTIKTIGAPSDFSMKYIPIVAKIWCLENEIEELSGFDIGVMPLPDDEWGRGKCGLKALQYMALGIPAVCSPVGVNREIIQDGVNGFLANSEEEWIEKLSKLIKDHSLRKEIGIAGRKTVEERYSLARNGPVFLDILNNIYQRSSGCKYVKK